MSKRKELDLMMDPEGEIGSTPPWLQQGKSIDTRVFCEEFLEENPMLCFKEETMKAQYGILRFAKYKGLKSGTSKPITSAPRKLTPAIPTWTPPAAASTSIW